MASRVVCVLGMHRSGTSCLAGTLQQAGLFLGEVNTQARFNSKGNRENPRIMALHDSVLHSSGGAWDDPPAQARWLPEHRVLQRDLLSEYRAQPLWGFKDPRSLLTLDGWLDTLEGLSLVGIYRHPLAVARSLAHRNQFSTEKSLALWAAYNERLLDYHRQHRFPLVRFDAGGETLKQTLEDVLAWLELKPAGPVEFYDPKLLHHAATEPQILPEPIEALWRRLENVARETPAALDSSHRPPIGESLPPVVEVIEIERRPETQADAPPPRRNRLWPWRRLLPASGDGIRFHLEAPHAKEHVEGYLLYLQGFVCSMRQPVECIEVVGPEDWVHRMRLHVPRPDVASVYPGAPGSPMFGFGSHVSTLGLPAEATLRLNVILADKRSVPLASLRLRCPSLRRGNFTPRMQPLTVMAFGRSGTTWLMRLLREHSGIVVAGGHPYEIRALQFWLRQLHFLSQPLLPDSNIDRELKWLSSDPRAQSTLMRSNLGHWFSQDYVIELGSQIQERVEQFYGQVAESQGRPDAQYLAEKMPHRQAARLVEQLYPDSRQIFLVRDFRDLICSMQSFNARRGFFDFGRQQVSSDDAHIVHLAERIDHFHRYWLERRHEALLIRYEDAVLKPQATLACILEYLGLEATPVELAGILARASADTDETRRHRTSASPEQSIGRWHRDLQPAHRRLVEQLMDRYLKAFGYDLEGRLQSA